MVLRGVINKIILLLGFFLVVSCHEDSITEEVDFEVSPPIQRVEAFLFGRIGDVNGSYDLTHLAINDVEEHSNLNSYFNLGKVPMNRDGQVIKVSNDSYTPFYYRIEPELGKSYYCDILLNDYRSSAEIEKNKKARVADYGILFNENIFLVDGKVYDREKVNVELHNIFAPNNGNRILLPIPNLIMEEETNLLEMVELFYLKIRGDQNELLDIAQNHEMIFSKEISSYSSNLNDYYLYHWDETRDKWIRGEKILIDQRNAEFLIPQQGWWTIARSVPVIRKEFRLELAGNPWAYQKVIIKNEETQIQQLYFTDDNGSFKADLDPLKQYSIQVYDPCGEVLFDEEVDLDDLGFEIIEIKDEQRRHLLKTAVFDCNNMSNTDVLFVFDDFGRQYPLKPNRNGDLIMYLASCHQGEFLELQAVEEKQVYYLSKTMIKSGNQDSIWTCQGLDVGGDIQRGNQRFKIDSTLTAKIDTTNMIIHLRYLLFGGWEEFVITDINYKSIQGYAHGNIINSNKNNHSITFNVHQIAGEGGMFIADFEGTVNILRSEQTDPISGSLVARIEHLK